MIRSLIKIICLLIIIGLNWTGLLAVGQTFAYFFDNENSNANIFTAATLDFSLSPVGGFSPNITPTQSSSRTISVVNDGILGFQYTVQTANISGTLCNNLNLEANLDGDGVEYPAGSLSGFNYNAGQFAAPEDWQFTTTLPSNDPVSQGQSCTFDFVFNGVQVGGTGFSDTETIQNTVWAGYWDPPVVLNEILPNPLGDDCSLTGINGEWVEIYNKTSNPLDLNNWYIKNSTGTQITISTSNTLGGSTTISANGWLVVFMDGCVLDNTSDIVTFYNQNDVQVDSYSYALPEYNANNTPGSTNDMVLYLPLNNDVLDQSGNGNNGINNGAVFTSGKFDEGLSFDGVDDYAVVNDSDSLDITSQITIETWIKPSTTINSANSNKRIVDKQNAYYLLFDYPTADGKLKLILRIGGNYINVSSVTNSWSANQWYHIVGTYDGSVMKIYVNGILENSKSKTGSIEATNYKLFFGNRAVNNIPTNMFFDGTIDEVKIYSRALNASEILSHYGQVLENKSYARIPDGNSNWVDPVPTPGGPNILELEIINQEEAIEEASAVEEEPVEELVEEPISEEIFDEEPAGEEVITEENQEEGGIIEEINEIIDEVIDGIVDEIMPDETINEPAEESLDEVIIPDETILEPEAPIIEEPAVEDLVIEEAPVVDEQPAVVPDGAGGSVSDGGSGENGSPAEGAGESSGDSGVDAGGESVSE